MLTLAQITHSNTRVACAVTIASTVSGTVHSSPAKIAFTLIIRATRAMLAYIITSAKQNHKHISFYSLSLELSIVVALLLSTLVFGQQNMPMQNPPPFLKKSLHPPASHIRMNAKHLRCFYAGFIPRSMSS